MKIYEMQIEIGNCINLLKKFENTLSDFYNIKNANDLFWIQRQIERFSNTNELLFNSISTLNSMYPLHSFQDQLTLNLKIKELIENLNSSNNLETIKENISFLQKKLDVLLQNLKKELNDLSLNYIKTLKKKINKDLISNQKSYLFHGLNKERAEMVLKRGSILGYTHQKYWDDGKRRKSSDPDYENYFLMKGISMTRDLNYALSWEDIVLVFDKKIIEQNYPIDPYAWNYAYNDQAHSKKEREEFIILKKTKRQFKNKENEEWMEEYQNIINEDLSKMHPDDKIEYEEFKKDMTKQLELINSSDLTKSQGEFDFSSSGALIGILLRSSSISIHGKDNDSLNYIFNHPLFWGIIDT